MFYLDNVAHLHQLTSYSTTSCHTTWRSYCDHRLLKLHFTLCIAVYCRVEGMCLAGWRSSHDCCTAVLHRLWPRDDERPSSVSDSNLHPRQLSCIDQVHAVLGRQDSAVFLQGLFCTESHCAAEGEGGHCQLRSLQVATVVLTLLRGVQVCGSEPAEEWRHHCCQLDWSLCRWWPGTGASWAVIPRDHCRLQQQVSSAQYLTSHCLIMQ